MANEMYNVKTKLTHLFSQPQTFFILGCIATVVISTLEFVHHGAENFVVYRDATLNFFAGVSSYEKAFWVAHDRFFIYTPVFHYLFAPFAFLPFYMGGYLWNIVNWVAFYFAIKTLPGAFHHRTSALIGYLLLWVMQSIFCFQFNILVCSIFLYAFTLLEKDKPFWAVLLIMISATTKVYGAIELALLLCYPKFWRNVGYAALCGLILVALPVTKLGCEGLIPWYQDWLELLTTHTQMNYAYFSLIWAQPIRAFSLPNMRLFQVLVLGVLSVLFFVCKRHWQDFHFKTGVLATLMIYIVLMSESAEFTTHLISATGFAIWYFQRKEHTAFEKVLLWGIFLLFGLMPIDIIFPSNWCMYIHQVLWIGVWVFTLAWGYLVFDTIRLCHFGSKEEQ